MDAARRGKAERDATAETIEGDGDEQSEGERLAATKEGRRMVDWLTALDIEEDAAEKAVVKLCEDGYSSLADLYRLAGSKNTAGNPIGGLMKYFSKLGHIDKVRAAAADSELELRLMQVRRMCSGVLHQLFHLVGSFVGRTVWGVGCVIRLTSKHG